MTAKTERVVEVTIDSMVDGQLNLRDFVGELCDELILRAKTAAKESDDYTPNELDFWSKVGLDAAALRLVVKDMGTWTLPATPGAVRLAREFSFGAAHYDAVERAVRRSGAKQITRRDVAYVIKFGIWRMND